MKTCEMDLMKDLPNEVLGQIFEHLNLEDFHSLFMVDEWKSFLTHALQIVTTETLSRVLEKYPAFPSSIVKRLSDFTAHEANKLFVVYYLNELSPASCAMIKFNRSVKYAIELDYNGIYRNMTPGIIPSDNGLAQFASANCLFAPNPFQGHLQTFTIQHVNTLNLLPQDSDFSCLIRLPKIEKLHLERWKPTYPIKHKIMMPNLSCLKISSPDVEDSQYKELLDSLDLTTYPSKALRLHNFRGSIKDVNFGIANKVKFQGEFTEESTLRFENLSSPNTSVLVIEGYEVVEFYNVDLPNLQELKISDQWQGINHSTPSRVKFINFNAPNIQCVHLRSVEVVVDYDYLSYNTSGKLRPWCFSMDMAFYDNIDELSQVFEFSEFQTFGVPFLPTLMADLNPGDAEILQFPNLVNLELFNTPLSLPEFDRGDIDTEIVLRIFKAPVLKKLSIGCGPNMTIEHFSILLSEYPNLLHLEIIDPNFVLTRTLNKYFKHLQSFVVNFVRHRGNYFHVNKLAFPKLRDFEVKRTGQLLMGMLDFKAPKLEYFSVKRMNFHILDLGKYPQIKHVDIRAPEILILDGAMKLETVRLFRSKMLRMKCSDDNMPPNLTLFDCDSVGVPPLLATIKKLKKHAKRTKRRIARGLIISVPDTDETNKMRWVELMTRSFSSV